MTHFTRTIRYTRISNIQSVRSHISEDNRAPNKRSPSISYEKMNDRIFIYRIGDWKRYVFDKMNFLSIALQIAAGSEAFFSFYHKETLLRKVTWRNFVGRFKKYANIISSWLLFKCNEFPINRLVLKADGKPSQQQ